MDQPTVQIDVPRSLLVAAFLEKMARASAPPDIPFTDLDATLSLLPAIGADYRSGKFAGITIDGLTPLALVLLPGDEEKPWKEAGEWAAAQGGSLPTRMDGLVLWQNLPKEFQQAWYWTSEEYPGNADYAWVQSFYYGYQDPSHKTNDYRCRAVRRVSI